MNSSTEQNDIYEKEPKQYNRYSFKEKKKLKTISGGASEIGLRETNEDTFTIIPDAHQLIPMKKNKKVGCQYFGIFDGHEGMEASRFCADLMHCEILEDPDFENGYYENCLMNAYYRMDWLLCNYHVKDKSGCTSVTAVIKDRYLIVANVGDSECLVIKCRHSNDVEVLTYKHIAKDESEKQRMKSKGGIVFNGRVYGSMVVSRSLGDKSYKGKGVVIPEPYINIYELTSSDTVVVLACDGVFEKMSYEDVMEYVCERKEQGKTPQEVAASLIQEAITRGSRDNVTAVIIYLNWC